MMPATATVVVNNHNYGRFLAAAVDSALAQSHTNLQVIVVDDGSTDESRELIAAYGSSVLAINKPNGGQLSAYNAAMPHVRGDLVVFLDADDLLEPTAIAAALDRMSAPCVKVTWRMWEVEESGVRTGRLIPDGTFPQGDLRAQVLEVGPDSYLSAPGSGNAWKRAFLERVLPGPEERYRRGADGFLITIAPLYGHVTALDEPLGSYRLHGDNGFWRPTLLDRTRGSLVRYQHRKSSFDLHRRQLGLHAVPRRWEQANPYVSWLLRVQEALTAIERSIEPGACFVIIDDDQLGTALVEGRVALPLIPVGGAPLDEDHAIDALEERAAAGVAAVALAWTASWWLDHYPRFASHLRRRSIVREDSHAIKVFELCHDS